MQLRRFNSTRPVGGSAAAVVGADRMSARNTKRPFGVLVCRVDMLVDPY